MNFENLTLQSIFDIILIKTSLLFYLKITFFFVIRGTCEYIHNMVNGIFVQNELFFKKKNMRKVKFTKFELFKVSYPNIFYKFLVCKK